MSTRVYKPELLPYTKTVNGAILFAQLEHWFAKKKNKPFYKFQTPAPEHPFYKPGTSLLEELGLSKYQLRTAFSHIGVAYKSKADFEAAVEAGITFWHPELDRQMFYASYLDRGAMVTFYVRNHQLIESIGKTQEAPTESDNTPNPVQDNVQDGLTEVDKDIVIVDNDNFFVDALNARGEETEPLELRNCTSEVEKLNPRSGKTAPPYIHENNMIPNMRYNMRKTNNTIAAPPDGGSGSTTKVNKQATAKKQELPDLAPIKGQVEKVLAENVFLGSYASVWSTLRGSIATSLASRVRDGSFSLDGVSEVLGTTSNLSPAQIFGTLAAKSSKYDEKKLMRDLVYIYSDGLVSSWSEEAKGVKLLAEKIAEGVTTVEEIEDCLIWMKNYTGYKISLSRVLNAMQYFRKYGALDKDTGRRVCSYRFTVTSNAGTQDAKTPSTIPDVSGFFKTQRKPR